MIFTVDLPPNKTYAARVASLVRHSVDPLLGVLEVRECRADGGKAKISRYAVKEDAGAGGRVFRLTKPGGGAWHFVCLGTQYDACECEAGLKGLLCKHVSSLRALWSAGHLDPQPKGSVCYGS